MAEDGRGRLGVRPVVSRSVWALVAQGFSSSSNFVLSALVLTSATRAEFGLFSICLMSYLLAAQLSRSVASRPMVMTS